MELLSKERRCSRVGNHAAQDNGRKPTAQNTSTGSKVGADKKTINIPKGSLFWSKRQAKVLLILFGSFICMTITVSAPIVYFTSKKETDQICQLTFKRTIGSSVSYNSRPTHVATGDLNNDNHADLVLANFGSDEVGVLLGRGDGTFGSQTSLKTGSGSHPRSVAIANLNNDQNPDLVVANYGLNGIGLLFGYGDGNFANQVVIPLGASRPVSLAVGDVNNDNRSDIVVAANGTSNVIVLLGANAGSFRIHTVYYMGHDANPSFVLLADLNGDNHLDIVVANQGTSNVVTLIGNGDSTFRSYYYSTGKDSQPRSIAVGDFNNDNRLDFAVANFGSDNIGVLFGDGKDTFGSFELYPTGLNSRPQSIGVADFNADNKSDIVVFNSGLSDIIVFQQLDNKTLSLVTRHETGYDSTSGSLVTSDLDNDGRPDIGVTDAEANSIFVLTNYAEHPVTTITTCPTGVNSHPVFLRLADFNHDRRLDIVVVNQHDDSMGILIGQDDGVFGPQTLYPIGNGSQPRSLAVGDLNGDNHLDIVAVKTDTDEVCILLGDGTGSFQSGDVYFLGTRSTPYSVILADFNNDSRLDIVTGNVRGNNLAIFLGHGDGTFANMTIYPTPSASSFITVAASDINNDYRVDIVVASYATHNLRLLLGYGNGSFAEETLISTGDDVPVYLLVEDLNNDTQADIVYTSPISFTIGILYGYGNGSFASIVRYQNEQGSYPWFLALGDVNNDGLLDIGVVNLWVSSVSIFIGHKNQTFALSTTFSTGSLSEPISLALTDINNDGQLDMITANSKTNEIAVLFVHQVADFQNTQSYETGSGPHPSSVMLADFNGDRHLEIVVANSGNDNIQLLTDYDQGNGLAKSVYLKNAVVNPAHAAVGDLNRDKKLDIVVANYGAHNIGVFLGTNDSISDVPALFSTGYESFPTSTAVGDVNDDGWTDLVVANEGTNNIAVFLGFDYPTFSSQIMLVPGNIPSPFYTLAADFNNDGFSDFAVVNFYANNIGIYLGYGNGSFSAQFSFPVSAVSNPVFMTVGDLNHDGYIDIIVASHDRYCLDILLGHGNGSFSVRTPWSGDQLITPSSVASGDFDNDSNLDIAVAYDNAQYLEVLFGDGQGTCDRKVKLPTGESSVPNLVAVADFNHDGYLDIVYSRKDANITGIFLGLGNALFREQILYPTENLILSDLIAVGDVNNDGNVDVVVGGTSGNTVGILFGSYNGTFLAMRSYFVGSEVFLTSITIADLNNDKAQDIIFTDWGTDTSTLNAISVLFGYGNGNFAVLKRYLTGTNTNPMSVAVADFNNDMHSDMVMANFFSDSLGVFLRFGSEPYSTPLLFSTGDNSHPKYATVADLNNDKHLDITVANSGADSVGVFLGYGDGRFAEQRTYATSTDSVPLSLAVSDINHDNCTDVVVANSASNNIAIMLGDGNGNLILTRTYSTGASSHPSSVAVDKLDKDNHLDIVVSNFGANNVLIFYGIGNGEFVTPVSYSVGYNAGPRSISIGDINDDDRLDISVANYGTDYVEILLQTC